MHERSALGAYRANLLATGDAKAVEAAAFAHVNNALSRAARRRDSDWPGYVAAVSKNLQLWTAVAADVLNPENRLPSETRGRILSLARFVRSRSMEILNRVENADAGALIDINANIAEGLRGAGQSG